MSKAVICRKCQCAQITGKGINVVNGQASDNIANAALVVISTAIKADNPEVIAARERFIPIVHRAEMLGELMRLCWSIAVRDTWQNHDDKPDRHPAEQRRN